MTGAYTMSTSLQLSEYGLTVGAEEGTGIVGNESLWHHGRHRFLDSQYGNLDVGMRSVDGKYGFVIGKDK